MDLMKNDNTINRRAALRQASYLIGGVLSASTVSAVMSGCKPKTLALNWTPEHLAPDQALLVREITERIIPATDSPGSKDAMVDRYIDVFLKDIAGEEEKVEFHAGLIQVEKISEKNFKKSFVDLSDPEKDQILTEISGQEGASSKSDAEKAAELANEGEQVQAGPTDGKKFFNLIRQLTLTGFFTSEIGAKKALILDEIPGDYIGCIPYADVGGAWAI